MLKVAAKYHWHGIWLQFRSRSLALPRFFMTPLASVAWLDGMVSKTRDQVFVMSMAQGQSYPGQVRLNSGYVIMADRTDLWGVTRSPCSTVQSSDRVMVSAVNLEVRSAHFTVQLGPN